MIATEELLWEQLGAQATPEQVSWLEDAVASVLEKAESIRALFPAVGRRVGRRPLDPAADPDLCKDILEEKGFRNPDAAYDSLLVIRAGGATVRRTSRSGSTRARASQSRSR